MNSPQVDGKPIVPVETLCEVVRLTGASILIHEPMIWTGTVLLENRKMVFDAQLIVRTLISIHYTSRGKTVISMMKTP